MNPVSHPVPGADDRFVTHTPFNQVEPPGDRNLFRDDAALRDAVGAFDGAWAVQALEAFGSGWGTVESFHLADLANRFPPELHTHDALGRRADTVDFHPAWHELLRRARESGFHSRPWTAPRPGAHAVRAAAYAMHARVENGSQCPITMTFAAWPALAQAAADLPWLRDIWLPRIASDRYDPSFLPIERKAGALIGMGMTEKQGGSDVRSNTTTARAEGDGSHLLLGHKWFLSAPMCDAFLVLAQAPAGPSCFFVPRFLPDGTLNALRLQRLKDKLGNRSNASSEVEFHDARGWLIGEEGRGIATILGMGTYTRLDCAIGSLGIMREALSRALHNARHRSAFGRALIDQPLMRNVLADLALEAEAATWLVMRLARAFDGAADSADAALRRILTPVTKYWVCKRTPAFVAEAMEAIGGIAYVEESPLPRLYREAPVNSIWEGAGNVMCLDMLRAMERHPEALAALFGELRAVQGRHAGLDRVIDALTLSLEQRTDLDRRARTIAGQLAQALQGALLLRHAPPPIANAFCASRFDGAHGQPFGTLPADVDLGEVLDRAIQ